MPYRILVTGGAGFIGSHLAKRCSKAGHNVTVIDNLTTGSMNNVPKDVHFIEGDISDPGIINSLPENGYDIILHLAAQSSGEVSNEQPELDLTVNTLGTLLLLKWSMKNGVNHFIYASSMATYGEPKTEIVREEEPCLPLSYYGISKVSSEHYIRHFSREGLNTTIFRMFSVYGPGQNMENLKQGMVSIFLAYLSKHKEIHVKGDPFRFRDFIYIDDVINAWMKAIGNPAASGNTYNLATGVKTTVSELVEKEIKIFGEDPATYPVRYQGSTPSDQFGIFADIQKIKDDLGWEPVITLDDGLHRMIHWLKESK